MRHLPLDGLQRDVLAACVGHRLEVLVEHEHVDGRAEAVVVRLVRPRLVVLSETAYSFRPEAS